MLKTLSENQLADYRFSHLMEYSEPQAPDYDTRIFAVRNQIRKEKHRRWDAQHVLVNFDSENLNHDILNYKQIASEQETEYLKHVAQINSFINADAQYDAVNFMQ